MGSNFFSLVNQFQSCKKKRKKKKKIKAITTERHIHELMFETENKNDKTLKKFERHYLFFSPG